MRARGRPEERAARGRASLALMCTLWLLAPSAVAAPRIAGTPDEDAVAVVGDEVHDVSTNGHRTLIAGWVKSAGMRADGGAVVSASTGILRRPVLGAQDIRAVVAAPGGGWFVADGAHVRRITPSGTIDPSFSVRVDGFYGSRVSALVVSPDGSTLYLAGSFERVGGTPRWRLAAVSTATGGLLPWNPITSVYVESIEQNGIALGPDGRTLVAAGEFSLNGDAQGRSWAGIAVDTTTAAVSLFAPDEAAISAYVSGDGGMYILAPVLELNAGFSTGVAGFAAADLRERWRARAGADGTTGGAALDPQRGTLYVSGSFRQFAGARREGLVAIDARTGRPTDWVAQPPPGGLEPTSEWTLAGAPAGTLAVSPDGDVLFSGPTSNLQAIAYSTVDGSVMPWSPGFVGGISGGSIATMLPMGDDVLVGGDFGSLNGVSRWKSAMLDETGAPTTWSVPDPPHLVVVPLDSELDGAGTAFLAYEPMGSWNDGVILAVDARGRELWRVPVRGEPRRLALSPDRRVLYVGGTFDGVDGFPRSNLAALRVADGAVLPWAPALTGPGAAVWALAVAPDETAVYVGGKFDAVGEVKRVNLAALSAADGTVLPLRADTNGAVAALAPTGDGRRLFVAGPFGTIGGQPHGRLARLDTADGSVAAWYPEPDRAVQSLALSPDASTLVAGGQFRYLAGGLRRYGVAAYDADTLDLLPWDPKPTDGNYSDRDVMSVAFSPDGRELHVAGGFEGFDPPDGHIPRPFYARFSVGPGPALPPATIERPAILGTIASDEMVACDPGRWDGSPRTYAYGWQIDGSQVPDADRSELTLPALHDGQRVGCWVTARNDRGSSVTASRTAVVGGPDEDPSPIPTPTPTPTRTPRPTPTPSPAPTPDPNGAPAPHRTPTPSVTPAQTPMELPLPWQPPPSSTDPGSHGAVRGALSAAVPLSRTETRAAARRLGRGLLRGATRVRTVARARAFGTIRLSLWWAGHGRRHLVATSVRQSRPGALTLSLQLGPSARRSIAAHRAAVRLTVTTVCENGRRQRSDTFTLDSSR